MVLLIFESLSVLHAQTQTTTNDPSMVSTQFDTTGFPQWAKDLRRGEIVAFGSFPFVYFFTNFGFDSYRWATHGQDISYAPWPFTGSGAVEKTQSEKVMTIGIAAGGAVIIALVDFGIELYKRNQREAQIRNLPKGTPIIVRKPLQDTGSGTETESAAPEDNSGSP